MAEEVHALEHILLDQQGVMPEPYQSALPLFASDGDTRLSEYLEQRKRPGCGNL